MQQTKPLFAIRKYPSIRWAAIIAETVNSFVSLTDSMVAGNLLGSQTLTAIGLVAPFLTFSTLGSSIVNSGKTMAALDKKAYLTTTGCNRNALFFAENLSESNRAIQEAQELYGNKDHQPGVENGASV